MTIASKNGWVSLKRVDESLSWLARSYETCGCRASNLSSDGWRKKNGKGREVVPNSYQMCNDGSQCSSLVPLLCSWRCGKATTTESRLSKSG